MRRLFRSFLPLALAAPALLLPAAARAELVVLTDGSVLKVKSYLAREEEAVLTFEKGGSLTLSLLRVERVVDDEIAAEPEAAAAALEASAATFAVRFAPGQTAPPTRYGELIFATARRHELNPELVAAVVRAESAFDPRARSNTGARGLMQLMPATARRYGVRPSELFEPERNLEAGVRYLRFLADRFADDLPKMLAGYNAGEGSVDRYRGIPPYRETQGYVRRVLSYLGLELASASR